MMESVKNIFDEKYKKIVGKMKFDDADKKIIHSERALIMLFLSAGLMKTTPQHLLAGLDLDSWAIAGNAGAIKKEELNLIALEYAGGDCFKCGKPWQKVENEFIGYYKPGCFCYPRCYYCNRFLWQETANKEDKCRHCGYRVCTNLVEIKDDKGKATGRKKMCGGRMLLIGAQSGNTVYTCDQCQKTDKRIISI